MSVVRRHTRAARLCPARAFTLVEMIATLVVLAVVVPIGLFAAVSFLKSSWDTDGRARLLEVAAVEQTLAQTWGRYSDHGGDLDSLSGDVEVTHRDSTGPSVVSATLGEDGTLGLAVRSTSGRCLYVRVVSLLVDGAVVDVSDQVPSSAPCRGTEALPDTESPATYPGDPISVKTY